VLETDEAELIGRHVSVMVAHPSDRYLLDRLDEVRRSHLGEVLTIPSTRSPGRILQLTIKPWPEGVALFCDDQLFVKPTVGGKAFIGKVKEAPPYPGAKPCYLISGDRCEDGEWLSELMLITERELPPPRPKASKARSAKTKPSKANARRPSRR
jgi:hypothetical protein